MKTTIRIEDLEKIIKEAKENHKRDNSFALCVEIENGPISQVHGESDSIRVRQLNSYADCDSKTIMYINF